MFIPLDNVTAPCSGQGEFNVSTPANLRATVEGVCKYPQNTSMGGSELSFKLRSNTIQLDDGTNKTSLQLEATHYAHCIQPGIIDSTQDDAGS